MTLLLLRKYWPIVVTFIFTIGAAWYLFRPTPPPPEPYTPPVIQSDGSLKIEKKPNAGATTNVVIPSGSRPTTIIKMKIRAKTPISDISTEVEISKQMAKAPCSDVDLELVLVKNKDNTQSVIAKSDNGEIIGAVHIPIEAAKPVQDPPRWAMGAVVNPAKQTYGAFVDRDFGPFRLGAQVNQRDEGGAPNQVWLKAGIAF